MKELLTIMATLLTLTVTAQKGGAERLPSVSWRVPDKWIDEDIVKPRIRVIIDNDFGGDPDGLFHLAQQLLSPSAEVRGVVCSHHYRDFYEESPQGRPIRVFTRIDTRLMLEDLVAKLKLQKQMH